MVGEGDSRFVYVDRRGRQRAKRTAVRTGLRRDGRVEILEGLKPGQKVVTEGVVKLTDGHEGAARRRRQRAGARGQRRRRAAGKAP